MSSEKSHEKKDDAECCSPEQFRNMFQMMSKCRSGKGRFDCTLMMDAMKSRPCCAPETGKAADGSADEEKSCC